ncbi:MAG: tetratricopeptide repeat protein, partial [Acidobacteriota bacterium]|nr:tetratricopeptide repeat protein [Acidobacteriota bacterium]
MNRFGNKIRTGALLCASTTMVITTGCSMSPAQYVENGNKAFDSGKYAEAQIDYQKAIQKDPSLGEAYFRLGKLQLRQADAAGAFNNLSTAIQLLPTREDVAVTLADACLAAYLQNHRSANYYDQLLSVTARLTKSNPGSYDALRLNGYIKMIDRNYPEAVDALKKANAVKPMQQDGVHALVQCLIQNNQGPEAEQEGLALIREKKTFSPMYDTLYRYYERGGRLGDGEAILKAKVANNPTNPQYRLELAAHYARTQNPAAMAAVIKELRDTQKFPNALMEIGNFYVAVNRPDDALREFEAGAKEDPKRKADYQKRTAEVLLSEGKKDEALVLIDAILKERPTDFETRVMRAGINVDSGDQGRLSTGMAELETLVKEKPTDATTRFNLGKARLRSGDENGALTDFKEALRLDPQLMQARVLAANTSLQTQDFAAAGRYADEILEVASDNPLARLLK